MKPKEPVHGITVLKPIAVLKPRANPEVSQRDLVELLYLEKQMMDAATLWRIKKEAIQRMLEMGCSVENGLHVARLDTGLHVE